MRPSFHVNISEQFTIHERMRSFFEGSVKLDLQEDVYEDDYLRKEVPCSKTMSDHQQKPLCLFNDYIFTIVIT